MPPAAVDDPEHHNHDGFYLRLSLPLGWQTTRFEFDSDTGREDFTVSGAAVGFELRLGGTPAAGLAIGVQVYNTSARAQDVSLPSDEDPAVETRSSVTASSGLLNFFVDYFPDPRGNFHVGASLGLATHVIDHEGRKDSELDEAAGLGASAWAGYAWWVSKNWSIGGLGLLAVSTGQSASDDMNARSLALAGMFSLLYH